MRRALIGTVVVAGLLSAGARGHAQLPEVDPCKDEIGQSALNACWAREVERADAEMDRAYETLRDELPSRAASRLEKAQKLWRKFRDAQVSALYAAENPRAVWGREYRMCVSISRYVMARARTRELRRMREPDPEGVCPL